MNPDHGYIDTYYPQESLMQKGACQFWRQTLYLPRYLFPEKTLAVAKQENKRDFATKFAKTQGNRKFCNR